MADALNTELIERDDVADDYLLGRQVAHEFFSPAAQAIWDDLSKSPAERITGVLQVQEREKKQREDEELAQRKAGVERFYREQKEMVIDPVAKEKMRGAMQKVGGGRYEGARLSSEEVFGDVSPREGLEEPVADPIPALSGGFGSALPGLAIKGVMPTLGRAFVRGILGAGTEYAIAPIVSMAEVKSDFSPWILSVGLGMMSGITLENLAEEAVTRGFVKTTKPVAALIKNIREGNFEDPAARKITEVYTRLVQEQTGIFAGYQAETINVIKFKRAKELIEAGVDPERVRLATGFFRGDDGFWRWELSDRDYSVDFSRWKSEVLDGEVFYPYRKVKDVIDHKRLFAAYPEIKDVVLDPVPMDMDIVASISPRDRNVIRINEAHLKNDPALIEKSLIHELQHWIQLKEGWAIGGSPEEIQRLYPDQVEQEIFKLMQKEGKLPPGTENMDPEEVAPMLWGIDYGIQRKAASNVYRKLAGETEANDALYRWITRDSERIENFPEALRVWTEFEKSHEFTHALMPTFKQDLLDSYANRMKELGFDIEDPAVFDAFANRNFAELLPRPEVIAQSKELIWRGQREIDPALMKRIDNAILESERIFAEGKPPAGPGTPKFAIAKMVDRFGVPPDATPAIARNALKLNRKKILRKAGSIENVYRYLTDQGYSRKLARNIQAYLESERDLPFPTSVKEDAKNVLKYKGLSAGSEWYRETHLEPLIEGLDDMEMLRFFALIGHTSRQADPLSNLTKALKVWKKYLAGMSPEEAAKGSGMNDARVADLLRDDESVFRVVIDEIGQEAGEVKIRDFANTIRLALRDPEALRAWSDPAIDFRMGQLYYPERVAPKWYKGSKRAGSAMAAQEAQMPLSPIQRERIKERISDIRNYLRETDDAEFWTADRVQAALWTHIKNSRAEVGLDRKSPTQTFEHGLRKKAAKHFGITPEEVTDDMIEGYVKATGVAPLGKYRLAISPITSEENIAKALQEGDIESAQAMRRARQLELAGDRNALKDMVVADAERIFDDPTINIVRLGGAEGRWAGGKEFSLDFAVEANDYDILRGRVAQFLKRYRQTEGYISKLEGFTSEIPVVPKGQQGPSIHLNFPRELNEKELTRFSEILNRHGIGGSTYIQDGNDILLHHITKYNDDYESFVDSVTNAVGDWISSRGIRPNYSIGHYVHDILEGGTGDYDRAIQKAIQKSQALGLDKTIESRKGERAGQEIQSRFVPSQYSPLAKAQRERPGIFERLMTEQRGSLMGEPLSKFSFEFEPGTLDLPFKDKVFIEKAANINLDNIVDEEGIHDALNQTAQVFEQEIGAMRRGVRSNKATMEAALKEETLKLSELLGRQPGQAFNAEQATRARILLTVSSNRLVALAKKAMTLTASDLDKFEFYRAFGLHGAIQAQVSGMTAEAGRALQALGIKVGPEDVVARQVRELMENAPGGVSIDKLAAAVATMDNPKKVGKFVNKARHAKSWDMLTEYWINSLLSGPQTHVVNVTSTTLNMLLQVPERWLAGKFSKVLGHEGQGIDENEAAAMAYGLMEGIKDGLRSAAAVIKTGQGLDPLSKLESTRHKAITAENVRNLLPVRKLAPNALEEGGLAARGVDLLGSIVRIPGVGLEAEDTVFKSIAYRMELRAQAVRKAVSEFPGDSVKQAKRVHQILEDPVKFAPEVTLAAQDFARYATYTKKLGKYGQGLQKFASHPGMRFIIPFVRTPTNLLKFGFERTPFGLVNALRAGTPAERDLALARASLGSLCMIVAGGLAANGLITGGGPAEGKVRKHLEGTGWKPYSIKIGDTFVSYNRLEPLGMTLGLAADFVELTGMAGDEFEANYSDFEDLAAAITAAISKNVTSKTWIKGLGEAIDVVSEKNIYQGKRWIEKFGGSFVPSVAAGVERAVDPELQSVWGIMDALKNRLPGASTSLPPLRDYWGEPITNRITDSNWVQALYGIASPIYLSKAKDSPIDKELVRLKEGLPYPRKTQSIRGIPVPLEPWEYDQLAIEMNTIPMTDPFSGKQAKNLKEALNNLIATKEYKDKYAEDKIALIRNMANSALAQARMQLYEKNLTVKKYVDEQRLQQQMGVR